MKKVLIILFMVLLLPAGLMAQGHWSQFTKITRGTKVAELKSDGEKILKWYVKPTANLTAIKLEYDAEKRIFNPGEFSAGGVGIGFQHYVEHNGELVNDLAQEFTVSEDGLTYYIKIRDDAFFHDGKPITTDDLIFTIQKTQDPAIKSPKRPNWDGVIIEKINVIGSIVVFYFLVNEYS